MKVFNFQNDYSKCCFYATLHIGKAWLVQQASMISLNLHSL